ncbi:transcriptional adapter 3 [Nilaparvata lugens]|uniref:transcriptional adapter 3 n=1 Tax=Nilaparvata lugens TaxID=108931 RepID=UPI00193D4F51|nr:transcriptional adapter 3 [Nilaparvata lugens]
MKHVVKKGVKPKDNTRSNVNGASNVLSKMKDGRFQKASDPVEECVLSFPDLRIMTKAKLPCMTSILLRSKEENINMADLNQLQEELETMLSSVVIRKMNLNNEIDILNNMEDKKGSLPISNKTNQPKKNEERTLLKIGKPFKDSRNSNSHKNKLKSSSMLNTDSEAMSDADGLSSAIAKMNETANKFWAYVEQFCGDISAEDIKLLKELIESCEKEAQARKIPPLGKHYTQVWNDEDIADERDVSKMKRKADGTPAATTTSITEPKDTKDYSKKGEKICMKDRIPGPLAQRMISAVLEENPSLSLALFQGSRIKTNDDEPLAKRQKLDMSSPDIESKGGENTVPNSFKKIPLLHNTLCFERNARKNLELIGFLDPLPSQEEDDEILTEIKKCQEELKTTALRNLSVYRKLLKKAEAEMARAPLRNEMKQIDAEIIEIYKKIADTKLKKKAVGEKVKKQAWKLINDRESLQKRLDALAPELTV